MMHEEFIQFLQDVPSSLHPFIEGLHEQLLNHGCHYDIQHAKSGYVVSYRYNDTKHTLATYVFRKSGMKIRIFGEHAAQYEAFLQELPQQMKKEIKKASLCKRMLDPSTCNPRCSMGYAFHLDGVYYQKCRHMAFLLTLHPDTQTYIAHFLMQEINAHETEKKHTMAI